MQTHHLILFVLGLAILWGFCVLTRKSHPDDRASGTLIGQASHAEDAFHHQPDGRAALRAASPAAHFITVCSYCHAIYSIEGHWRTHAKLGIRDTLKVSHGICPDCEPGVQAALDRELAALSPNSKLKTPNSEPVCA